MRNIFLSYIRVGLPEFELQIQQIKGVRSHRPAMTSSSAIYTACGIERDSSEFAVLYIQFKIHLKLSFESLTISLNRDNEL